MLIGTLFWLLTLTCCVVAAISGGPAGRWGAGIFLGAVAATHLALEKQAPWGHYNATLTLVDFAHFGALYVLAVVSRRLWPIWSAGFQLLAALTNIAILLEPETVPKLYRALENLWSLPMLITMAVGAVQDGRARRTSDKRSVDDVVTPERR